MAAVADGRRHPSWQTGVFIAVLGAGMGFLMQTTMLIAQNSVEQKDLGVASSTSTFFRSIGGSFGVSLFGAVFNNRFTDGLTAKFGAEGRSSPPAAASSTRPPWSRCPPPCGAASWRHWRSPSPTCSGGRSCSRSWCRCWPRSSRRSRCAAGPSRTGGRARGPGRRGLSLRRPAPELPGRGRACGRQVATQPPPSRLGQTRPMDSTATAAGYVTRRPAADDAHAIHELISLCDTQVIGKADMTLDDVVDELNEPGFDKERTAGSCTTEPAAWSPGPGPAARATATTWTSRW
nr:hypothetical protein GCM10020093_014730 [Planobispora longispora]